MNLTQDSTPIGSARVVRVRWQGTGYNVVRVGATPGPDWMLSCASGEQLGAALRGLGVSSSGVGRIFKQLERSEDAEVGV
jgi:hypothetical protein